MARVAGISGKGDDEASQDGESIGSIIGNREALEPAGARRGKQAPTGCVEMPHGRSMQMGSGDSHPTRHGVTVARSIVYFASRAASTETPRPGPGGMAMNPSGSSTTGGSAMSSAK